MLPCSECHVNINIDNDNPLSLEELLTLITVTFDWSMLFNLIILFMLIIITVGGDNILKEWKIFLLLLDCHHCYYYYCYYYYYYNGFLNSITLSTIPKANASSPDMKQSLSMTFKINNNIFTFSILSIGCLV